MRERADMKPEMATSSKSILMRYIERLPFQKKMSEERDKEGEDDKEREGQEFVMDNGDSDKEEKEGEREFN